MNNNSYEDEGCVGTRGPADGRGDRHSTPVAQVDERGASSNRVRWMDSPDAAGTTRSHALASACAGRGAADGWESCERGHGPAAARAA